MNSVMIFNMQLIGLYVTKVIIKNLAIGIRNNPIRVFGTDVTHLKWRMQKFASMPLMFQNPIIRFWPIQLMKYLLEISKFETAPEI